MMTDENQRFVEEMGNEENQDKIQLEINKRAKATEDAIFKTFRAIFRKGPGHLSKDDKAFLQARRSYLTKGQREEYAEELAEDVSGQAVKKESGSEFDKLMGKGRSTLNDLARQAGVEEPEGYPSKEKLVEAILAISPK